VKIRNCSHQTPSIVSAFHFFPLASASGLSSRPPTNQFPSERNMYYYQPFNVSTSCITYNSFIPLLSLFVLLNKHVFSYYLFFFTSLYYFICCGVCFIFHFFFLTFFLSLSRLLFFHMLRNYTFLLFSHFVCDQSTTHVCSKLYSSSFSLPPFFFLSSSIHVFYFSFFLARCIYLECD